MFIFFKKEIEKIVNINKIIIPVDFLLSPPKESKISARITYFRKMKKFHSPIIIDKNWNLVDGYTSYVIAKKIGMKHVSVKIMKRQQRKYK